MNPFDRKSYIGRGCVEQLRILREEMNGVGDKDIHNLEYILYDIYPGSILFKRGCIRSLRKAIKLFKKQKGDDTMPSVEHMRSAISDAYPGEGWKFRCQHMHANQVIAIYGSLMRRGAFESNPEERKFVAYHGSGKNYLETSKNCLETATDARKSKLDMVEPSGEIWVQLSMF